MTTIDVKSKVNYDDAAYMRYLPEHLRERYEEGLQDSELTHLRKQIALLDVRIKLLLENLDRQVLTPDMIVDQMLQEFPDIEQEQAQRLAKFLCSYLPESFVDHRTFRRLDQLVTRYKDAMAARRLIEANNALETLFAVIAQGRQDNEVWNEINDIMDNRRRLVEAENRRELQAGQLVATEQVVVLLGLTIQSLREAVRRYVPDRKTQQFILEDAGREYAKRIGNSGNPETDRGAMD